MGDIAQWPTELVAQLSAVATAGVNVQRINAPSSQEQLSND